MVWQKKYVWTSRGLIPIPDIVTMSGPDFFTVDIGHCKIQGNKNEDVM